MQSENLPFVLVDPHVLPELREKKFEKGVYAFLEEFSLEMKGDFPAGKEKLKKLKY